MKETSLTYLQKQVIIGLREGRQLAHRRYIGYSAVSWNGMTGEFVNKNTINGLKKRGLIEFKEKTSLSSYTYHLTQKGKEINLD